MLGIVLIDCYSFSLLTINSKNCIKHQVFYLALCDMADFVLPSKLLNCHPFVMILQFWRSLLLIIRVSLWWQFLVLSAHFLCVCSCLFPLCALQAEAATSLALFYMLLTGDPSIVPLEDWRGRQWSLCFYCDQLIFCIYVMYVWFDSLVSHLGESVE